MYKIAYQKHGKAGRCELCGKDVSHLERHHIRYSPEICKDLCHDCHFKTHYFPERLPLQHKRLLLHKIMDHGRTEEFLKENSKDRVRLAITFAPSRRDSVLQAQRDKSI